MRLIHALLHALTVSGNMTWDILWSLILGFILSAIIQAVVRKATIARLMGNDNWKTMAETTGLGIASSSCSYAAVAISRTLFRNGATFLNAMIFEIASTNLVIELGIIMAILLGWRFTLAEFIGGPLMIIFLAVLFRIFLRRELVNAAIKQADQAIAGSMEGHAAMDMTISKTGSFTKRLLSEEGITSVSHIFVMEVTAIWKDIVGGLLLAGAIAAWVPANAFRFLFLSSHPVLAKIWDPFIGPAIAMVSFVCSIGNVPLAAVLWNAGISFGGVISFMFADLIIIPILLIYRKYYGSKMMLFIFATFYATMTLAGWVTELIFGGLGILPKTHHVSAITADSISLNYTAVLNGIFILLVILLVIRFISSGALPMLKMMEGQAPKLKNNPSK